MYSIITKKNNFYCNDFDTILIRNGSINVLKTCGIFDTLTKIKLFIKQLTFFKVTLQV